MEINGNKIDFTIIGGCTMVAAAFGYMVLGKIGAILVLAGAGYGVFSHMQEQNKLDKRFDTFDPTTMTDAEKRSETKRLQRELYEHNRKKKERRLLLQQKADREQRAEERRLAKAAALRRTKARRRKSIDPTAENPLDAFDEWLLDTVGTGSWTSTVVFCVAHLAEELTGFRPGDYGISEFTTMSGVNSESISDYVRNAKHNSDWLDNRFDPNVAKSGPTACPGIGTETGKKLAKEYIHTTRQLLVKFNSFSGLSTKSQYRRR